MRKWLCKGLLGILLGLSVAAPAAAGQRPDSLDILKLPEWTVSSNHYGGKLLLSDSPETVTADGILYQDKVVGDVRLFFHHVNGTTAPKKIVVLLENDDSEPAQVTVYQYGLGGPGHDYLAVGKTAQLRYFGKSDIYLVEVPAKDRRQLIAELDSAVVEPNMLVNGIYDFKTDRPVTVKVMMLPVHADAKKFVAQAKVLPPDQYRLRGTFDGANRLLIPHKVYNPDEHGPVALTLADNEVDRYVEGIDATDGSKVLNYGNYGVVYKLFLPSAGVGKADYFLNPRGGVYAGALSVKYRHETAEPLPTPSGQVAFGADKLNDFAPIGTFDVGQSLWLTFSPPGASNLPVKIVILPQQE